MKKAFELLVLIAIFAITIFMLSIVVASYSKEPVNAVSHVLIAGGIYK